MISWLGLPILAVVLGFACAWRIGRWLMGSFRFHSAVERAGFTVAAGLAVMSFGLLPIGLAGGLHGPVLWAVVAVVALSDVRRWRLPSKRVLYAAPLLLLLWPFVAKALRPPAPGDALLYHLPLAKSYALHH